MRPNNDVGLVECPVFMKAARCAGNIWASRALKSISCRNSARSSFFGSKSWREKIKVAPSATAAANHRLNLDLFNLFNRDVVRDGVMLHEESGTNKEVAQYLLRNTAGTKRPNDVFMMINKLYPTQLGSAAGPIAEGFAEFGWMSYLKLFLSNLLHSRYQFFLNMN